MNNQEKKTVTETRWSSGLIIALASGIAFLLLYTGSSASPVKSSAIGLFIAGSASAIGIFIGFLFGIPRTLQRESPPPASAAGSEEFSLGYGVNTNLEQISDWLTKIIVGVGLVQLTAFPGGLQNLSEYLAGSFGQESVPGPLVGTIICYFGIFSFLLGYLWTRLYLTGEFSRAEREIRDKPEFYEGIIQAFLYRPKPEGFRNAIRYAEKYNSRFGPSNERVWISLACAYGQEFSFLAGEGQPDPEALAKARAGALEAVRRALQINPETKEFLRRLWDPTQVRFDENDLVDFFNDPDFKQLLGP